MPVLAHNADSTDGTDTSHQSPPLVAGPCDPATACSCNLDTETGPAGPIQVLRVSGESTYSPARWCRRR